MQGLMISGCKAQRSPVWVKKTATGIHNCIFTNNSAKGNGGALNAMNGLFNITNTTFVGNSAGDGGAIHSRNSKVPILRSFFINNTAEFGPAKEGVIFLAKGVLMLKEHNFFSHNHGSLHALGLEEPSLVLVVQ